MGNKKPTGVAVSMPSGLAWGAFVGVAMTALTSLLGAQMIHNEVLDQEMIGYCSLTALLTGTILGAMTSMRRIQRRNLQVCLLNGAIYFCILLASTALFFGGQYEGVGISFVTVTLGSLAAAILRGWGGTSKKLRRKKI